MTAQDDAQLSQVTRPLVSCCHPQMPFDFDFLKDRYDYELQRREQLTAALTLPVGVLTAS